MRKKPATAHAVSGPNVTDEDVFSAEYLAFARAKTRLGFIFDPRNRLNEGQALRSADTFVRMAGSTNDVSALSGSGIHTLRKELSGDWMVVRIDDPQQYVKFRADMPSMEVVPAKSLQPQWAQSVMLDVEATMRVLKSGARRIGVKVVDEAGAPIVGAKVVVVFDSLRKLGAEVRTDEAGRALLAVPSTWKKVESFAVMPVHSYWSHALANWSVPKTEVKVVLRSLKSADTHPLRQHVQAGSLADGKGVVVGVIDSGVGPHPDLVVAGGANLAIESEAGEGQKWTDNGLGHGTHVAGIIAGRGVTRAEYRGIAPGVTLRSYRVFSKGTRECDDPAVADAIAEAVADGCDLINLSLGFEFESRAITRALSRATASGAVAIAAVGNGARRPVYFPAATPGVIGVSAIGRANRIPAKTMSSLARAKPAGKDANDFVAAFTNIGLEVTATAPGVGIISCFPGGFYAVEDGTSMAAPVVTGLAARQLAQHADILHMPRDQTRADAMRTLVLDTARTLGFGPKFVGSGLP